MPSLRFSRVSRNLYSLPEFDFAQIFLVFIGERLVTVGIQELCVLRAQAHQLLVLPEDFGAQRRNEAIELLGADTELALLIP